MPSSAIHTWYMVHSQCSEEQTYTSLVSLFSENGETSQLLPLFGIFLVCLIPGRTWYITYVALSGCPPKGSFLPSHPSSSTRHRKRKRLFFITISPPNSPAFYHIDYSSCFWYCFFIFKHGTRDQCFSVRVAVFFCWQPVHRR